MDLLYLQYEYCNIGSLWICYIYNIKMCCNTGSLWICYNYNLKMYCNKVVWGFATFRI